jgi:hypothetical protein
VSKSIRCESSRTTRPIVDASEKRCCERLKSRKRLSRRSFKKCGLRREDSRKAKRRRERMLGIKLIILASRKISLRDLFLFLRFSKARK